MKLLVTLLLSLVLSCAWIHAQEGDDEGWPDAFSRHFKGTIGDKLQIEMQLQSEPSSENDIDGGGHNFRGQYWYANKRIPIDLFGSETDFGIAKLEEHIFVDEARGWRTTGTFEGEMKEDGSLSGTWSDPDGKRKLPFKIVRFEAEGAVKLKAHALESSWSERTKDGESGMTHTALVLQVVGDTAAAKKINQTLLDQACTYFTESEEQADDAEKKNDEKSKPTEAKAKKALTLDSVSKALQVERDEELIGNHERWSASITAGIEFNERGLLCVSHLYSQYTGGAHPNSVTEYFTFNTKTGAELELKQLFKPGFFVALPKLANEKLRALDGPKEKGKDKEDEATGPTIESLNFDEGDAGWFISVAGFVVHFDPYAIASYARGSVDVTIPWAELEPWLAPDSALKPFVPKKK